MRRAMPFATGGASFTQWPYVVRHSRKSALKSGGCASISSRTGMICCNRLTGGKRLISGYDF
jgi:hypothetical protein